MARILKKIPNFKLPKYKMRDIEDIEELNIEYTPEVIEGLKKKNSKSTGGYQGTEYKTIKEIFLRSTNVYRDRPFILEKFNRKGVSNRSPTDASAKTSCALAQDCPGPLSFRARRYS